MLSAKVRRLFSAKPRLGPNRFAVCLELWNVVVRPNAGVALHCIAPAASAFLAEQLATLIVAISHKHTRLPTPYLKEGTVSCLSWGSFTA